MKACSEGYTGLTIPDVTRVATAYGIPAIVIRNQRALREDVKQSLMIDGPVIIDVHVMPDEVRAPRIQSYQKADGSLFSKPLEDLFPFLPREEFLSNMIVAPLKED